MASRPVWKGQLGPSLISIPVEIQEYLGAIRPCSAGLLLETFHYQGEITKSDSFFSEIPARPANPELLEAALR